jgi:hypothetical protein
VQRYIDAWETGDVDAIVARLAEDVTIAMPPWATWWRGREVIAGFVRRDGGDQWRLVPTRASGQLAAGAYRWDAEARSYRPDTLEVLALGGARVKHITAFAIRSPIVIVPAGSASDRTRSRHRRLVIASPGAPALRTQQSCLARGGGRGRDSLSLSFLRVWRRSV